MCEVLKQLTPRGKPDSDSIYAKMYELLGDPRNLFSEGDLFADIDAVNLAGLTSSKSLGEVIVRYYSTSLKQHFIDFVSKQVRNGSPTEADLYNTALVYTNYKFVYVQVWPILKSALPALGLNGLTADQSSAFATAFSRYIWEYIEA
jgi:hypothetical protein